MRPSSARDDAPWTREILNELNSLEFGYRREAMDAALAQREAVTPALLDLLDNILADPQPHIESDSFGPIYALTLLGHFAEPTAHGRIVALAKLPESQLDRLFGDAITELLPVWLWQTHGNRFEDIKSLLLDQNAYHYCRVAAATVLVHAVTLGLQSREEILALLAQQLSDDESNDGFNGNIARDMLDLCPSEYEARLREMLDNDLFDPWTFPDDELDEALANGPDACMEQAREAFEARIPADVHFLSRWACFRTREEEVDKLDDFFRERLRDYGFPQPSRPKTLSQADKAKRKRQRKTSTKARQKNRKKKKK